MFSTLPYIIDAPIEEILEDIPIVEEVKQALITKEGSAGKLYELLLVYERADWQSIKRLATELGIQTNVMVQVYMDCVEEVNNVWENLVVKLKNKKTIRVDSESFRFKKGCLTRKERGQSARD